MVNGCIAPAEIQEGDLVAYLEGAASTEVVTHIARCPACAAEVEALRLTGFLLQQALNQAGCPVEEPPAKGRPRRKSSPASRVSPGRTWSTGLGLNWQPLGLALALVVVLLALPVGLYVIRHQIPPATPQAIREQVTTVAVTVEETAEIIKEVTTQVTQPNAAAVEQNIHDSLPTGRVIIEEMVEIAPPRSLRQKIEREFQGQTEELAVYSAVAGDTAPEDRQVVNAGSQAYAIWTAHRSGQTELYFVRSADGGETWSNNVQINRGVDRVYSPNLAVDTAHNHLYVIWRSGYRASANMYLARSMDNGQTWSTRVRVEGAIGHIFNPNLAVDDNGSLYVTWQNREQANFSIYFIQSGDGGETWSDIMRVARVAG
ncbi:MAG: sialidase family protein [Chloroflexota bacterium]